MPIPVIVMLIVGVALSFLPPAKRGHIPRPPESYGVIDQLPCGADDCGKQWQWLIQVVGFFAALVILAWARVFRWEE
jgi:hypothetical protein